MATKICIHCGKEIDAESAFCPKCGTKQARRCINCGKELAEDDLFCPKCGTRQESEQTSSIKSVENKTAAPQSPATKNTEKPAIKLSLDDIELQSFGEYNATVEHSCAGISEAIQFGYIKEIEKELKNGEEIPSYALHEVHNAKTMKYLLEHGAQIEEGASLLGQVIGLYSGALANFDYDENSFLKYNFEERGDKFNTKADIRNKYLGIIKVLLENGIDPNDGTFLGDQTVLYQAIDAITPENEKYMSEIALFLIKLGKADIHYVPPRDHQSDYDGYKRHSREYGWFCPPFALVEKEKNDSALQAACEKKNTYLCKLLIELGADVNYTSCHCNISQLSGKEIDIRNVMDSTIRFVDDDNLDDVCTILKLLRENGAVITESTKSYIAQQRSLSIKTALAKTLELSEAELEAYRENDNKYSPAKAEALAEILLRNFEEKDDIVSSIRSVWGEKKVSEAEAEAVYERVYERLQSDGTLDRIKAEYEDSDEEDAESGSENHADFSELLTDENFGKLKALAGVAARTFLGEYSVIGGIANAAKILLSDGDDSDNTDDEDE